MFTLNNLAVEYNWHERDICCESIIFTLPPHQPKKKDMIRSRIKERTNYSKLLQAT